MTGVEVMGRRPRLGRAAMSAMAALASLARGHRALVLLLVAALALRIVAEVAVYPGIWFSDSNGYVTTAATGTLSTNRVGGYSLFVAPFWHAGSAGALIATQHVIGLGLVVLLYALLLRRGVPRLLAVLAVAPAALDAYLIYVEHVMMSETIFHAAVLGALAVLLWNERPGLVAAAAGGILLGYAGVVRSVAVPFIILFVVYLLVRRAGWKALAALVLGWVLVTGAYASMFKAQHGTFGFTQSQGRFLYAKTAPFADCSRLEGLPASERRLCPDTRKRMTTNAYLWGKSSPIRGLPHSADDRIGDFAMRVVRDRPLTYARVVALDFLHYFEPGHRIGRNDYPVSAWQFPVDPNHYKYPGYRGPIRPGSAKRKSAISPNQYIGRMVRQPRTNVAASRFLHYYQRFAYTSGQLLAACLLVVLAALVTRRGGWRLRIDAALVAASVVSALLLATALSVFSYRYGLGAVIFLPAAAALAGAALLEGRRRPRAAA